MNFSTKVPIFHWLIWLCFVVRFEAMTHSLTDSDRVLQRAQFQQLAVKALELYGLAASQIEFISDSLNTVFQVVAQEVKYAFRIHPPENHSPETIEAELLWLAALRRDTELIVPEPVAALDGRLVPVVALPGLISPRPVVVFKWVEGELLDEDLSPDTLALAGAFMAQLHGHARRFTLPEGVSRRHAAWGELRLWQHGVRNQLGALTEADDQLCQKAAQAILAQMSAIDVSADYGLTHSDLHQWNYLLHQGEIRAIDFDDCQYAPYLYDIAVSLSYLDQRADYERLRDSFLSGYRRVRPLPKQWAAGLEMFMAVRALDMVGWVLSWPTISYQEFGPGLLADSLQRLRRYTLNRP
jgi:Ser/Thr protein kinase RdoA (MazF antagonist)